MGKHTAASPLFPEIRLGHPMKLTDSVARTEKLSGKQDVILWDGALVGFGLRIRKVAKGIRKQWIVQYRDAARESRRFIIGTVEELSAAKARDIAADKLAGVRLGIYPHATREQQRKEAEHQRDRDAETFGVVSALYLANREKALRERSFLEVKRHIEKHWEPFAKKPIHEINRRAIAIRLTEISAVNGPVAANRARATLSAFFSWAMGEGIVEHNPVAGTNKAIDEDPRDRVLTDAELGAIWAACRDDEYGRIVKLLMLTGQRREEVGGMLWDELGIESGLWTMQGARTKNGKRHILPLVPEAIQILGTIKRRPRRESFLDRVFGTGEGGFGGWSKAKINLDARIVEARGRPIADWRLHDLRRTVKTIMADKLDVRTEVSEAILNHAKQGMEAVYNGAQYLTQKRRALEMWADYLRPIIEGADRKVVPLRPKA
jgi:integrase